MHIPSIVDLSKVISLRDIIFKTVSDVIQTDELNETNFAAALKHFSREGGNILVNSAS